MIWLQVCCQKKSVSSSDDVESSLIKLNASGVGVEMSMSEESVQFGLSLHALILEDLLIGHRKEHCKYLARSKISENSSSSYETTQLDSADDGHDVFYETREEFSQAYQDFYTTKILAE